MLNSHTYNCFIGWEKTGSFIVKHAGTFTMPEVLTESPTSCPRSKAYEKDHGSASAGAGRVCSLDGLRGVACLMVLLLHLGMMLGPWGGAKSLERLVPGTASVMVFFVLSGVVLSLAPFKRMASGQAYDWFAYFPRRIVRLLVPTCAAILLAVLTGYVAWRMGSQSRSATAIDFAGGFRTIVHDAFMQFDLLFNVSDDTVTLFGAPLQRADSPVWSMSWELWFSLTLPLAVWCVSRIRRDWLTVCAIAAALFVSHWSGYFPLRLCLMFWLGVILAKHASMLMSLRLPAAVELVAVFGTLVLIETSFLIAVFVGDVPAPIHALLQTMMNLACMGLVALAMTDGLLRRALSVRPILFLGRISFSLYLTHAIVIGGLAAVLPKLGVTALSVQTFVAFVASLLFGWCFYLVIERPSILWSRSLATLR